MVLAAGAGTRLEPLTLSVPKVLVPVLDQPVSGLVLKYLARHGVSEVVMNLHHLADAVQKALDNGSTFGVHLTYSPEESAQGTAGGVKRVEAFFDGTFVVIGGDDLTDVDLGTLIQFHRKAGAIATIGTVESERFYEYGVVETGEEGRIQRFVEKPQSWPSPTAWVNTGIYVFEPEILDLIPPNVFYDFGKQVFPDLLDRELPFYACRVAGYWCDIGNPEQYLQANVDALEGLVAVDSPVRQTAPGTWVGKTACLWEGATVVPPVLIGDGCEICKDAVVGPRAVLGPGSRVGERAEVEDAVLWAGTSVKAGRRVARSILSPDCEVRVEDMQRTARSSNIQPTEKEPK